MKRSTEHGNLIFVKIIKFYRNFKLILPLCEQVKKQILDQHICYIQIRFLE